MHRFIIISCLFVAFISCKKSDSVSATSMYGRWELVRTEGQLTINYPHDQGNLLILSTNQYQSFFHDSLTGQGDYSVLAIDSPPERACLGFINGAFTHQINFNNNTDSTKTYFDQQGNVLRLGSGCFADDSGVIRIYNSIPSTVP